MKEIEQDVLRTAGDYFAESPSLEERVARIEARDRVEELLAHYARCVDAQDAQGVGAAFTEDGEMCNPGMPALKGRARITKLLWEVVAGVAHVISPYWRAAGFVCVEREGVGPCGVSSVGFV